MSVPVRQGSGVTLSSVAFAFREFERTGKKPLEGRYECWAEEDFLEALKSVEEE